MKNSKNYHGVPFIHIYNHIWKTAENEFASSLNTAWPSHTGMVFKHFDASNDLNYGVDRRFGVIPGDVSLDGFQIVTSGARPL